MTPEEIFAKGSKILASKVQDYTSDGMMTRYENFERQAQLMSWFKSDEDKCFVAVIAIKLARLASLLESNKAPNHESIEDTFVDLVNYCALWGGFRTSPKTFLVGVIEQNSMIYYCSNCGGSSQQKIDLKDEIGGGTIFFCSLTCKGDYVGKRVNEGHEYNVVHNTIYRKK